VIGYIIYKTEYNLGLVYSLYMLTQPCSQQTELA